MVEASDVIKREREFHNARFAHDIDPRAHLDKWYKAIQLGMQAQNNVVLQLANNKDVLEYGCSDGGLSIDGLHLPKIARTLTGIDISDVAINKAMRKAEHCGYRNCRFFSMNAEDMSFEDGSFDLVFGRGIIHHLDLDRCYSEVARVLKPGGKAVFYEPLGHNPILNIYRNRTPDIRTADEHPLLMADFDKAAKYFSGVHVDYYGLASVASALLPGKVANFARHAGELLDGVILKIPGIRKYAWYSNIILTK